MFVFNSANHHFDVDNAVDYLQFKKPQNLAVLFHGHTSTGYVPMIFQILFKKHFNEAHYTFGSSAANI